MISNKVLAEQFSKFAELLELKGEIRFKIVAYQRAAQTISNFGEPLELTYEKEGTEGLQKINSIGKSISNKIAEYIQKGKIRELEDLKKGFPRAEIEFMEIPGVGPKTAKNLFLKLKAHNISDLKKKLKSTGHKHFKEKTLQNIFRGIEIMEGFDKRVLLFEAKDYVDEIVDYLKQDKNLKKIFPVGSFRRWKETVGDIDIIAVSPNPKLVIGRFVKFPEFIEIISQGVAKSTVIHKSGIQVDLEILPQKSFGSLLQHFTGSKEHNVHLRTYAQTKGLSVSEHGIKIVGGTNAGKIIYCETEIEVYKTLGLSYIEPELREDRGEIEASLRQAKGEKLGLPKGDLHVHSNWSDGQNSIEEIVKKAIDLDYEYVAIADHTVSLGVAGGLNESEFDKREKEIHKVQKKYPQIKIFNSCEVNIRPSGSLDLPDKLMQKFDIVTASVHWSFRQSKDEMTKRLIEAIKNPFVNIIGHPTGRIINRRESCQVDGAQIFKECANNNITLEINAQPDRLDLPDSLVYEARKIPVKFAVCTDAHSVFQMESMIYGVSVARRGWCEKKDILNTMDLKQIISKIKK
ncbi:MAG: DNA polymerase/3'-5' exonuclease PolX [Candidatus Berkelbacteria bacterium]|nr:DNA polymerase/3'-5' exonuclease PolX [Candidatus Berkelbacteria bacterium]